MKIFVFSFLLFCTTLFANSAQAYVPKIPVLLQKWAENTGAGVYQIDLELSFPAGSEVVTLKESWTVDGPNKMRLTVRGTKELRDFIKMSFVYDNGVKSYVAETKNRANEKQPESFIESFFHFHDSEELGKVLTNLKVIPASALAKKPYKPSKEPDYQATNFARLSRVGGVIAYVLGLPSGLTDKVQPNFWLEQDVFVPRKFRFPDGAEVSADEYSTYSRNLMYPRSRQVRWDNKQVNIQTLNVYAKSDKHAFSTNLSPADAQRIDIPDSNPAKAAIVEFYQRFR